MTIHADRLRSLHDTGPAEIAVEHDAAVTLTVLQSSGKSSGIVEFTGEGDHVRISVPVSWKRREVRGGALAAVTSDPPALGFTRWHLPESVTVSFRVKGSPGLTIRQASETPLLVLGKRVDVVSSGVIERSVLLKEGERQLW